MKFQISKFPGGVPATQWGNESRDPRFHLHIFRSWKWHSQHKRKQDISSLQNRFGIVGMISVAPAIVCFLLLCFGLPCEAKDGRLRKGLASLDKSSIDESRRLQADTILYKYNAQAVFGFDLPVAVPPTNAEVTGLLRLTDVRTCFS